MEQVLEVPKYIRYDFFATLIGIFSIGSWWYFSNVTIIKSESTGLLLVIGIPFLIWGMAEMLSYYKDEKDLIQIKSILEKKEILEKLKTHKIIDNLQKEFLISFLKADIKDIIESKKEN